MKERDFWVNAFLAYNIQILWVMGSGPLRIITNLIILKYNWHEVVDYIYI